MKAWQGPSLIDGREIMLCLSGLKYPLRSKKLGDLIQASVLPVDEPPQLAVKSGADVSVCGSCSRRFATRSAEPEVLGPQGGELVCPGECFSCRVCWPKGPTINVYVEEHGTPSRCYVLPWTAPKRVWETYVNDEQDMEGARAAISSRHLAVRLTAWGDPTAVPIEVWNYVIPHDLRGPSYTRRWRENTQHGGWWDMARYWNRFAMASVESLAEAKEAQALGWRTYRVGGRT